MAISTSITPFIRILPWSISLFTLPVLGKITLADPGTFFVLGICPGLSFVFWLLIGKNLWKIECDPNAVYAEKGNKRLTIPFEKITGITIGSAMNFRVTVFVVPVKVIPKCSIDYIDEKGREDSINFYGKSYEDVETTIYRAWRQKKIGVAQESLKRRKARR